MANASHDTIATAEERRLQEAPVGVPWRAWGPYLSERQWGTVREDYGDSGDAWSYFCTRYSTPATSNTYGWALLQHYRYYGEELKVECPTGSGTMMTLLEVAQEFSRRLVTTFLRGSDGRRPVYGGSKKFQDDPYWRDLVLFYEYFHGDNGAGLGASHQTGWTGLVAKLIQSLAQFTPAEVLADNRWPLAHPYRRLQIRPTADRASTARSEIA